MGTIALVGLDLDGTLLNDDKQISPRTYAALAQASAEGVHLVPVTGRPHFGIPEQVRELPFVRYIISCNGASTWDNAQGKMIRERLIPTETCFEIAAHLAAERVPYEILHQGLGYGEQWVYDRMIAQSRNPEFLREYIRQTRKVIPDLSAFLREGNGLEELFITAEDAAQRERIAAHLETLAPLGIVFPFPLAMEVTAPGVDKGEALLSLAVQLGVAPEGVMAIGDSGNDLAMLDAAAIAVAMGNATREVKEKAHFVTESNAKDGVALAVERFVLEQTLQKNEHLG